jgi:gluconokinase
MILVVAGVAGSGKSTIGALAARRLGWKFADGDEFHPAENIAKMEAGIPLTDADRWPWLAAIGEWMDANLRSGESAVLACSALKRSYREFLLSGRDQAYLVFLWISPDADEQRVQARKGHFFGSPLLASQFAALERPEGEDRTLVIDCDCRSAEQVLTLIIEWLGLDAHAPPPPGAARP